MTAQLLTALFALISLFGIFSLFFFFDSRVHLGLRIYNFMHGGSFFGKLQYVKVEETKTQSTRY
jgi:hypothetical protein